MKIIILKNNLKEGLSAVEKAVAESNNNLPILKNVLVKTYNNRIKLAATNLEMGIIKLTSGKIIEEGSITVPFNTLYNIISNSDSERINLETDKNNLIVKTDNYTAKIQGVPEEEFPIIPKINNEDKFIEINGLIYKDAISKIMSAAHISEIRPEISGILFDFQLTFLKCVATDAFRLAYALISTPQFTHTYNRGFKVIAPLKTIIEVLRIFPENQPIRIYIDQTQILFKNEELELISRLIDGEYPDYEQIMPQSFDTELTIQKDHFLNALKLVSNFSGRTNDIRLKLHENNKVLELAAAHQAIGENKYLIPIKYKGSKFDEVSFNWRYLFDGVKAVAHNQLIFGINGTVRPSVIKSPEHSSYLYIVMPIKNV